MARSGEQAKGGEFVWAIGIIAAVPKRRERRQHIGLLAYGRKVGAQKMPRAITFTAGFYSIGIPPEFIGMGRALSKLSKSELAMVSKHYDWLNNDLEKAARYFNSDNLEILIDRNPRWCEVKKDIELTQKITGIRIGPKTPEEKIHQGLTAKIIDLRHKSKSELSESISEAAVLRKSLG